MKTEVRSFIRLCNVYRRFVKDFASITAQLNKELRKTEPDDFVCSEEQLDSFNELKMKLTSPAVLTLQTADRQFVLDTDANADPLGGVLLQEQNDKSLRPFEYFSKTLTDAEKKYETAERECLAIIWAVLLLRSYLDRAHFILRTDHDSLKWLFVTDSTSRKLARWRSHLQEFLFNVVHIPGTKHRDADRISRLTTDGGGDRK